MPSSKVLILCVATTMCGASAFGRDTTNLIHPAQAIERAAALPETGITGVFSLTVRRVDKVGHTYFLDSEPDYRDQRNLAIAVSQEAATDLEKQMGASLDSAFKGKEIVVSGTARRVKIDFVLHDQPTGKYYYQTHVDVKSASQITVR
jgi:hypothetical protein